jgi:MFS transporter, DHA1 family, tetracycline resistance protein
MMGALSDQFGRRPVLLITLAGLGIDYFIAAWAPSIGWLFAARILAGVCGASVTTASAYIADITPPEKRAQAFGMIGAAFGIGFILGPTIGGFLTVFGLRAPFLVAGCLTVANFLYGLFVLPESLPLANRRPFDWRRANPLGAFLRLFQMKALLGLATVYLLFWLAMICLQSTWVLGMELRFGWGPQAVGVSLTLVGLMAAIVQIGLTKHIVRWLGEPRTLLLGLAIVVVTYMGLGLVGTELGIYLFITLNAFAGLCGPALQSLATRYVGPTEQGELQGTLTSLSSLAAIISPLIATAAFRYGTRPLPAPQVPGAPLLLGALLGLLALMLAFIVLRRVPAATTPLPVDMAPAPAHA